MIILSQYRIKVKGKKWWWPLFVNLLDSSIVIPGASISFCMVNQLISCSLKATTNFVVFLYRSIYMYCYLYFTLEKLHWH